MLSAIRSFYQYLIRQGLADNNPAQAVQAPKAEKRLPSTLDVDQMNALLDHTEPNTFVATRDRAIMELFYSSGLRLAELAELNLRDIDFGDQLVHVTGKGQKDRVCPVGSQAIKALQDWLAKRDQTGFFDQPAVFITQQGRRLGVRSIQKRLSFWGKKHGISDHVHPHRLRHAFASHMLESSGDLRAVQELLGHADISTTQIYTHVDFQHLAKVYDSAHPRAKKRSDS
jgi:integrase/recombinase XerC